MAVRNATVEDIMSFVNFLEGHRGERKAVLTRDIAFENGIFRKKESWVGLAADKRWVRKVVNAARLSGHPIVGTSNGYFLADTLDELQHAYNRLRSSANELNIAADALSQICLEEYWRD